MKKETLTTKTIKMARTIKLKHFRSLGKRTVLTDANVLIFRFWPTVRPNQCTQLYADTYDLLKSQRTRLVVTMPILNEVTNRVFKEQWLAWIKKQELLNLTPIYDYKQFRDSPTGVAMMDIINEIVKDVILKEVELVEKKFSNTEAAALFVSDGMDLPDRVIAAIAKERGYVVFTHDSDFVHTDVDILTEHWKILNTKRGNTTQISH
jgi:predicted nucleic acid-binding protein